MLSRSRHALDLVDKAAIGASSEPFGDLSNFASAFFFETSKESCCLGWALVAFEAVK